MSRIDHTLFQLADYPFLSALASKQTTATRLDGRACRHLYANTTIDVATVSAHELDLIVALGVPVPVPLEDLDIERFVASHWEPSPIEVKFFADLRARGDLED